MTFIRNVLPLIVVAWATSVCAVNPASTAYVGQLIATGTTYEIGQAAQGGVVIWTTADGLHGLVAALSDANEEATIAWAPTGFTSTVVGAAANGIEIGANSETPGKINTALIIDLFGTAHPYAALVATQYTATQNGVTYDDWFLPSIYELGLIQARRALIVAAGGTDLAAAAYWSSFEASNSSAWVQGVSVGTQSLSSKTNPARVRSVRSF